MNNRYLDERSGRMGDRRRGDRRYQGMGGRNQGQGSGRGQNMSGGRHGQNQPLGYDHRYTPHHVHFSGEVMPQQDYRRGDYNDYNDYNDYGDYNNYGRDNRQGEPGRNRRYNQGRDNANYGDYNDYGDYRDYNDYGDYGDYNDYGKDMEKEYHEDLKKWIEKMKSKDRFKVPYDQIIQQAKNMGVKFEEYSELEFYAAYLAMVTDYKTISGEYSMYLKMAKDFLEDDDIKVSPSEKLCIYLYKIVMGE